MNCSMSNITQHDAQILAAMSISQRDNASGRWVVNIYFGFIVFPEFPDLPAMRMRNAGLSEMTIRLLTEVRELNGVEAVIFDRDAPPLAGWPVQEW